MSFNVQVLQVFKAFDEGFRVDEEEEFYGYNFSSVVFSSVMHKKEH